MPPDPTPDQPPKMHDVVEAIAGQLDPDRLGTGPLAMLRRLDPTGNLAEPSLQRLLWRHVPEPWLAGDGLRRWALLIHAMALAAPDLHRGNKHDDRLGRALFEAGYTEGRLSRLLETQAEDLPTVLPRLVRFLVAKRRKFDPVALAWFVRGVVAGGERAEEQRTQVARDYYRAERDADKAA